MLIKRTSTLTGVEHELDLPITEGQLKEWQSGGLIQNVMPELTIWQREFMITGTTQEEWNAAFGPEE